jgi:ElaB/YqjD/DUF883 family membrane-anchored ribosome-binding protein
MAKTKIDPRKQAAAAAKKARAAAKKAFAVAKTKFRTAENEVNKHIKKDPAKAVMIAAAVGAAIGAVTMLALSKKKQ